MTLILIIAGTLTWALWPNIKAAIAAGKKPQIEPLVCQAKRTDGPIEICLTRNAQGEWSWQADLLVPDEQRLGGPYQSMPIALVEAWRDLAVFPVDYVISAPRDAAGMRLATDGTVTVTSEAHYLNAAAQVIVKAIADGDNDHGVVLSVLAPFGSGWNPLRVKIAGGDLDAAAARYASAGASPQLKAKAIMGLP